MRWKEIIILPVMMIALTLLAGCPRVDFYLDPETVTFGENYNQQSFRVIFSRAGNWEWSAETDANWLKISSDRGVTSYSKVEGKLSGENILFLDLIADRRVLNDGTTTAEVKVNSQGVTRILKASITKVPGISVYVNPSSLDFGSILSEAQVTIYNQSDLEVSWEVDIPSTAGWLKVSPVSGTIGAKSSKMLNFAVSREGVGAGVYSTEVVIKAGGKEMILPVSMEVPGLRISPGDLNFGLVSVESTQVLSFSNVGASDAVVSISITEGASWISLSEDSFTLKVGESRTVDVSVDPTGLRSNDYSGNILVRDTASGFSVNVSVRMRVPGLVVSPTILDFGKVREVATLPLSVSNTSPVAFRWNSTISASGSWLRISPGNGIIEAGQSRTVDVSVDPLAVDIGIYEGDILFDSNWGSAIVRVRMQAGRAPKLVVVPTNINFGDSRMDETVAIWNGGEDTIEWKVDTNGFPRWLILTPVDNSGVATGTVSGNQTSLLRLKVDRSLANPDLGPNYAYAFVVEGTVVESGRALPAVQVNVSMTVPQVPIIEVIGEGIDANGIPFINFEFEESEQKFVIRNVGRGTLEWSIDTSKLPAWIVGINPSQGSIAAGKEQEVKVSVSRTNLDYRGAITQIKIASNDRESPTVNLIVEVQVPKKAKIDVVPDALNYGPLEMVKNIDVANVGDPGSILNFRVITNKEWISVYPDAGISIGLEGNQKDWKTLSVAIDREKLEGVSSSGEINIVATKVVDGNTVVDTSVEAAKVTITVSAPALTLEATGPKLRIPSLVRYVFLFRDVQQRGIKFPEVFLPELAGKILITEDELPLEEAESNKFIMPFVKQERLVPFTGTMLIMLDASGSMLQSARLVEDETVSQAADPLRELYIRLLTPFIQDLPENYKIGIGVFNEREWLGSSLRMLYGSDSEPGFTYDKQVVLNRLQNFSVVDNGATELLPAIVSGILEMIMADGDHIPYDISDDRIMLLITDGKLTTPPGEVSPVADLLKAGRIRPLIVGWGKDVNTNVLVQLIEETGGHLYSTKGRNTGTVDSLGKPIIMPLVSSIEDWFELNPVDECDRSIVEDIKSQVVFEYIALNQSSGAQIRLDVSIDSPADDFSSCLLDQGIISTAIAHSQLDLFTYANDVRLGQIKLISRGIDTATGSADVIVYADYIPRNVSELQFRIVPSDAGIVTSVELPTSVQGGIISDWNYSWDGNILTLSSPGNPLPYGAFGTLCILHFANVSASFVLNFDVVYPQYVPGTENKYFTHPDAFEINGYEDFRPSNPYPALATDPPMDYDTYTVILPSDETELMVYIYNIGGSHRPTNVGLQWDVNVVEGNFLQISNKPEDEKDRIVYENVNPFILELKIDEGSTELKEGWNEAIFQFSFNSVFNNPITRFLTVYYYYVPPENP